MTIQEKTAQAIAGSSSETPGESGAASAPSFLDIKKMRYETVKAAAEIGEMTYEFKKAMKAGEDPFFNDLIAHIKDEMRDSIRAKKPEMRLRFELKKDYKPLAVPSNRPNQPIVIHDKVLMDYEDHLHIFSNEDELVAYYNAALSSMLDLMLDAGYVCTKRPLFHSQPGPVMPHGQAPVRFTDSSDLSDEFWHKHGRPRLEYGSDAEFFVYWGDEDFAERLAKVDSKAHLDAINMNVPLEDLAILPKRR